MEFYFHLRFFWSLNRIRIQLPHVLFIRILDLCKQLCHIGIRRDVNDFLEASAILLHLLIKLLSTIKSSWQTFLNIFNSRLDFSSHLAVILHTKVGLFMSLWYLLCSRLRWFWETCVEGIVEAEVDVVNWFLFQRWPIDRKRNWIWMFVLFQVWI